jgi:hypothetical protein
MHTGMLRSICSLVGGQNILPELEVLENIWHAEASTDQKRPTTTVSNTERGIISIQYIYKFEPQIYISDSEEYKVINASNTH